MNVIAVDVNGFWLKLKKIKVVKYENKRGGIVRYESKTIYSH